MFRTILLGLLAAAPVAVHAAAPVQVCDAVWVDGARDGRAVPVRIRMPAGSGKVPLVLFSHGVGGSLDSGTDWSEAWAGAGIAVINLQHAGSDRTVIPALMRGERLGAVMSPAQLVARVRDVGFVLDTVPKRPREGACDLTRIDMTRIGMSGHSFGAITTQAIAGQHYPLAPDHRADPRIRAAIAFSPSPPFHGDDQSAFGGIDIPFLSVTGTADQVPAGQRVTAADRLRPYRAMPPGGKYLLVLGGANHMAFNGQDDLRAGMRPDPHVRAVTIAATTAFWRATLLDDPAAKRWLAEPDGLQSLLAAGDRLDSK